MEYSVFLKLLGETGSAEGAERATEADFCRAYSNAWDCASEELRREIAEGRIREPASLYLREVMNAATLLCPEVERRFLEAAPTEPEAEKELATAYLPLVVLITLVFDPPEYRMLDVFQEGNEALHGAIRAYSTQSPEPFLPFAAENIFRAVSRKVGKCAFCDPLPEQIKCVVDAYQAKRYQKTLSCALRIDLSQTTPEEQAQLYDFLPEFRPDVPQPADRILEQTFSIDCQEAPGRKLDDFFFRMLRSFLKELGAAVPHLSAEISCDFPPYYGNLRKGYDDLGGYWIARLEDGGIREEYTPYT